MKVSAKLEAAALCFVAVCFLPDPTSSFFIDRHQSPAQHEWNYHNQQDWQNIHRQCATNAQSPVDIRNSAVIRNNQLRLHFYNYNQPTKFRLQNAHHTIKINPINIQEQLGFKSSPTGEDGSNTPLPDIMTADEVEDSEYRLKHGNADHITYSDHKMTPDHNQTVNSATGRRILPSRLPNSRIAFPYREDHNGTDHVASSSNNNIDEQQQNAKLPYNGAPTIKLDWLDDGNNEFKLRDIHFHWGERRDNGSEHSIDGRRGAMEMHLVHIKHGLDKSQIGFTSDSVAVIGVILESNRKSSADFNPIVNLLSQINGTDQPQEIEYKSINDLLPNRLDSFYTYSGSLTTPPCYEVVNWIVMSERINMNAKQIEMFRNLYPPPSSDDGDENQDTDHQTLIMPNVRNLQPINNRIITASFLSPDLGAGGQVDPAAGGHNGRPGISVTHSVHDMTAGSIATHELMRSNQLILIHCLVVAILLRRFAAAD